MSNIFGEEPELSEADYLSGQEAFLKKENMKKLIADMVRGIRPNAKKFEIDQMKMRIIENIQSRPDYKDLESYHILDEIERVLNEQTA